MQEKLREVIGLRDAREKRPETAASIEEFWYEPEIWSLTVSPASRVLYVGLCSFLGRGEINRKDLRNILKGSTDEEIIEALTDLIRHNILDCDLDGYVVRSVRHFKAW